MTLDAETDLREYLDVIGRRRAVVIALAAMGFLAALMVNYFIPPVYEAEAILHLSRHSPPVYATPVTASRLVVSRSFLDRAARRSNTGEQIREFDAAIAAVPVRGTDMLVIKLRRPDARVLETQARAIVQQFMTEASGPIEAKRQSTRRRLEAVTARLAEMRSLGASSRLALERLRLENELATQQGELEERLLALEVPVVIQQPIVSSKPVAPNKSFNLMLGAFVGFLAGVVGAFLLDRISSSALVPRFSHRET